MWSLIVTAPTSIRSASQAAVFLSRVLTEVALMAAEQRMEYFL
jgi:hypothetical protein